MTRYISLLGRKAIGTVERTGRAGLFLYDVLAGCVPLVRRFGLVVQQLHTVGVLTLIIVVVSGLFVGMVLGFQGYNILKDYGTESSVGLMAAKTLTRELGPVMAGLLFTGRACSALTAEIGLMKATEQLASMEMMAVNPFMRILAPRFLAGVIAMPLLASLFTAVGIFGAHLIGVELLSVDVGVFWNQMQSGTDFYEDIMNGLIKSAVFGVVVTWIALFEGYEAVPTSAGVSQATTRTVVYASLAILGLDFIMTALMFGEM